MIKPWVILVYIMVTSLAIVQALRLFYVYAGIPYWLYLVMAAVLGGINGYYARRIATRLVGGK